MDNSLVQKENNKTQNPLLGEQKKKTVVSQFIDEIFSDASEEALREKDAINTGLMKRRVNVEALNESRRQVKKNCPPQYEGPKPKSIYSYYYDQLENTDKSKDSFAMSQIKEKLLKIVAVKNNPDMPDELKTALTDRVVFELNIACLAYRRNRFSDGEPKNERHIIVGRLIETTTMALSEKSHVSDYETSAFFSKTREDMYALGKMGGMTADLAALDSILCGATTDEAGYRRLVASYDTLITKLQSYADDTGRHTSETKKRYRAVTALLAQLTVEKSRLLELGFKEKCLDQKKGETWQNLLASKRAILTADDGKEKNINRGLDDAGMTALSEALGVGELYVHYDSAAFVLEDKKGNISEMPVSVERDKSGFLTKAEIKKLAKEQSLPVFYDQKTITDLSKIQMVDMICGVKDRPEDSLGFEYRRKKSGNTVYIELTNVHVLYTRGAFTGENGEAYNKKAGGGYRMYDPGVEKDKRRFLMGGYDLDLADRIMGADPEKLLLELMKQGVFSESQKSAFLDRISCLKEVLSSDKKKGLRNIVFKGREETQEPKLRDKAVISMTKSMRLDTENYNYLMDKQLIRDRYDTDNIDRIKERELGHTLRNQKKQKSLSDKQKIVDELNAVSEIPTRSGKKRRDAKLAIASELTGNKDLQVVGESRMLFNLRSHVLKYVGMNPTAGDLLGNDYKEFYNTEFTRNNENLQKSLEELDLGSFFGEEQLSQSEREEKKDMIEAEKALDDKKYNELLKSIEKPQKRKWSGGSEELFGEMEEVYFIKAIIRDHRKQLKEGLPDMSEEQKAAELKALDIYEKLFSFAEGSLDTQNIPQNARVINDSEITYYAGGKPIPMVATGWMPLFEHEPCIEDVIQGGLGDCYLLGSIGALVESNPEYIKNMMHDNGDTVTVRLYEGKDKPVYVTVKKELPAPNASGSDRFARGAFWVMYIEKAFTMMKAGTSGIINKIGKPVATIKETFMKSRRYYDHTESGTSSDGLFVLTGGTTESTYALGINNGYYDFTFRGMSNMTEEEVASNSKGTIKRTLKFIEKNEKAGNPMTAGTAKEISELFSVGGEGLNNEGLKNQVASGHVYSVLGTAMVGGKKMIKLRNPWGDGRIKYDLQHGTDAIITIWGDTTEPGVFYITPERFVAHFSEVVSAKIM